MSPDLSHYVHSACCLAHWTVDRDTRRARLTTRCEHCGKPGMILDDIAGDVVHCCNGTVEIAHGGGIIYLLCDSCMEPLLAVPDDGGVFREAGGEPGP